MDTEIQEESPDRGHRDSCARPDSADRAGARDNDIFRQGSMRSHSRFGRVSAPCGCEHDCPMAEGYLISGTSSGVSASAEEVLGETFLGAGISGGDDGYAD